MAIATLDAAGAGARPPRIFNKPGSAGVVGRMQTLWASAGMPGAGAYDTTLNGVNLVGNAVAGQFPRDNAASGFNYLNRLQAQCGPGGSLLLLDRLWHNGGINVTTTGAQTITQPTLPARDVNASTNGDGVLIALEISAATGAGAANPTISYTNQAGTSGRTATLVGPSYSASSIVASMYQFALQAGDTGVRSIQSLTLGTSMTSGTINLVAYRIIAALELAANLPNAIDWLTSGAPRLMDNSVPYLAFLPSTTATPSVVGTYVETQG